MPKLKEYLQPINFVCGNCFSENIETNSNRCLNCSEINNHADIYGMIPPDTEQEVNQPKHYRLFPDGTEVIEIIKASLTDEEWRGYCKGNILKYRLRAGKKGDLQTDIDKSDKYFEMGSE